MKKVKAVRKLEPQNKQAVVVALVVILLLVGLYFLCRSNGWLQNNKENFEGESLNRVNSKLNPGNDEVVMVLFFVDWCPHCTSVKPEWAKLQALNNTKINGKNVRVEACNCEGSEVEKENARDNNVEGYPSIKLITNSQPIDYNGKRTMESMKAFITEKCNSL